MRSLNTRLLASTGFLLVAFLGLTGFALDKAFRESTLLAVKDRLQTQIYMLLGVTDQTQDSDLEIPKTLPDPRLSTPGSGLYAQMAGASGRPLWRSRSMLGITIDIAPIQTLGVPVFSTNRASDGTELFSIAYMVSWDFGLNENKRYIFQVYESTTSYTLQVADFRGSLWRWLPSVGIVLLIVQIWNLRWGLAPLRRVTAEVTQIESGEKRQLGGGYPVELEALTANLNTLIKNSQAHLDRHRNALADLAHSLKTPLAVIRNTIDSGASQSELRVTIAEQVARLDQSIAYQLQRAAASGRLVSPVQVEPTVRKLFRALEKVYIHKGLEFSWDISAGARFYGDEADLMELLGNLLDNACKWAQHRIKLVCRSAPEPGKHLPGLVLEISDDGPGIPKELREQILGRGFRADPEIPGHGIGLAIVTELVEDVYQGTMKIICAGDGTTVRVCLPAD